MESNNAAPQMLNMDGQNPIKTGKSLEELYREQVVENARLMKMHGIKNTEEPVTVKPIPNIATPKENLSEKMAFAKITKEVAPPVQEARSVENIDGGIRPSFVNPPPSFESKINPDNAAIASVNPSLIAIAKNTSITNGQAIESAIASQRMSNHLMEQPPLPVEAQTKVEIPNHIEEFKDQTQIDNPTKEKEISKTEPNGTEHSIKTPKYSENIEISEILDKVPQNIEQLNENNVQNKPIENAEIEDDAPVGRTVEEVRAEQQRNSMNEDDGIRKLSESELIRYGIDYTTTHYRIIEATNPEIERLKRKGGVDISTNKFKIIEQKDVPDFDFQKVRVDTMLNTNIGRQVQVVAVQSGYSVMVSTMKHRELENFGRRMVNEDTYAYRMSMCSLLYNRLSNFSTGHISFNEWMNLTAWPDYQTIMFGLYMATFVGKNNFNITCDYCDKVIFVPIKHDSLVAIPPGSLTQQHIIDVLHKRIEPGKLVESSARWNAINIGFNDGLEFFKIRVPSIMEFLEHAYFEKRDDVINNNYEDMYIEGYIRGYGVLDVERYNKTGEEMYYYDTSQIAIDRALANMDPNEKPRFKKLVFNYINRYGISYQIPRIKCPYCKRTMRQKELNIESLFLTTRNLKDL